MGQPTPTKAVEATREPSFLLAKPEKRPLAWIATRVPRYLLPDDFTALGALAALGVCAAYQLSNGSIGWLWLASALLVVQWLGDSLDGTLARVRKIERPTYGYYLDHLVDAIATAAIGIGLGLSPLMLLSIGMLIVVAYLILSINVYLESFAFGRFSIGYGLIGPTEVRLILIALNTVVALGARLDFVVADIELTVFDVIGLAIAAVMLTLLVGRAARNLRELAQREPRAARTLRAKFSGNCGVTSCRPTSSQLVSPARFGREDSAAKAKRQTPLKGNSQSFVRAKATHGAGKTSYPRIAFLCHLDRTVLLAVPPPPSVACRVRRPPPVRGSLPAPSRATGAHQDLGQALRGNPGTPRS
ncbi:MAG TPA: CDP-alcohol phosphatidyltransferase family protein [Solirubrobacterales bacterium]|jgi:archaetidylinositol phosphate synthase|nr:CDP-alcohol phosphatidyltransferase family protein [Solirubrobacterales bacterium]